MDFGSAYILEEEELEEEEMEEDEDGEVEVAVSYGYPPGYFGAPSNNELYGFETEIMSFADEDEPEPQEQPDAKGQPPLQPKKNTKGATTNTVALKLESLHGEPDDTLEKAKLVVCGNPECGVAISHIDQVDKGVWTCKFCDLENNIGDKTRPPIDKKDVLYLDNVTKVPDLKVDVSDYKIVFVLDTSASMCKITKFKYGELKGKLKEVYDSGNQQPPTGDKPVEVTRLQTMKANILTQLEDLKKNSPSRKVALVTFSDKINIHGDGSKTPPEVVETESDLDNFSKLINIGSRHGNEIKPISQSCEQLEKIIKGLDEKDRTALGPALTIAISMASSEKPMGSKVILVTDGASNVGIGNLEGGDQKNAEKFYDHVITMAKNAAISVSVIAFDSCKLESLGKVAPETGGTVQFDTTGAYDVLAKELKSKTIAHQAEIHFITHKDLYVEDEDKKDIRESHHAYLIGNIQESRETISFNFCFKPKPSTAQKGTNKATITELPSQPPGSNTSSGADGTPASASNMDTEHDKAKDVSKTPDGAESKDSKLVKYPFQIQIKYKDMNGTEGLRIWTTEKPVTNKREISDQNSDVETTAKNFMKKKSQELVAVIKTDDYGRLVELARTILGDASKLNVQNKTPLSDELDTFTINVNKIAQSQGKAREEVISYFLQFGK